MARIGPFILKNTTKLKTLLPVGKAQAWALIATAAGLASWFPVGCTGKVAVDEELAFRWSDGSVERFRVRRVGARRSSLVLDWRRGAQLRLYLHGRHTTLTLEVEYSRDRKGRRDQIAELPLWAFRLSNLKSVAMAGRDLRSKSTLTRRAWKAGFIDG